MSGKTISAYVDETLPLTGKEVIKLVLACPLLFTAVKKKQVTPYFGANPEIMAIYDKLVLWMLKSGQITEDALK